ncbi:MAG: hypothetical protein ACFFDH_03095 [Promethearchaeota archaeon]
MDLNEKYREIINSLIKYFLEKLENKGIKLFTQKPSVKFYHKGKNHIGITLIDEESTVINSELVKKPVSGKYYIFISKFLLDDEFFDVESFAKEKANELLREIQEENAYSLNMKRVKRLLIDGHFAVAIVFLITSLETASRELFFRNSELWFYVEEDSVSSELLNKYGIKVESEEDLDLGGNMLVSSDGEWVIPDPDKFYKWKRIQYRRYVFKICKDLKILEDYKLSLLGNEFEEIGNFEILKDILLKSIGANSIMSFQRLTGKGSVKWCFNKFFHIDLDQMKKELTIISNALDIRHKIIHGYLDDDQITKEEVKKTQDAVIRIISFMKDEIHEWIKVVP